MRCKADHRCTGLGRMPRSRSLGSSGPGALIVSFMIIMISHDRALRKSKEVCRKVQEAQPYPKQPEYEI
eukprot:1480609-Amphidinium_carterae.1